jgi:integrase
MRQIFDAALEADMIEKLPTRRLRAEGKAAAPKKALNEQQVDELLEAVRDLTVEPCVMLGLYTGMRRGEACGLRWSDVDLAAGELSVRRSIKRDNAQYYVGDVPKTGASWRTLKMPASLAERVADRRAWAEGLAEELGVDDIDDWYVLGGPDGYLRPDIVSRDWTSLARALRLKGTRGRRPTFHDLRHTFASRLIAAGVDVRTVAALLGHSDASLVLRVYADALPEAKAAAMGRVDEVMGA